MENCVQRRRRVSHSKDQPAYNHFPHFIFHFSRHDCTINDDGQVADAMECFQSMKKNPLFEIRAFNASGHGSHPTAASTASAASAATSKSLCDHLQFFRRMQQIGQKHNLTMRDQPYDPGPAFARHHFGDVAWGIEKGENRAIKYFRNALAAKPGCNESTSLCATLAARGCGKSHIVDHLCRLHDKKKQDGSFKLGDLNARLVPVSISFNGPQTLNRDLDQNAHSKLVARLTHRCFFNTAEVRWDKFCSATQDLSWEDFSLGTVFEAMCTFFEQCGVESPVILIAVDEVGKCGIPVALQVLRSLKTILDDYSDKCRLLVTTFDNHQLLDGENIHKKEGDRGVEVIERKCTGGSKRGIEWIFLTRFDLGIKNRALRDKVFPKSSVNAFTANSREYLLSLTNGHPRTLALLQEEQQYEHSNFTEFLSEWQAACFKFQADLPPDDVVKYLLAKTILGDEVSWQTKVSYHIPGVVEGKWISIKELARQTFIVDSYDADNPEFVPCISLFALRRWTQCIKKSGTATPLNRLKRRVGMLICLGEDLSARKFEEFHLIFEQVRCWAWRHLKKNEQQTLGSWFKDGEFVRGGERTAVTIPQPTLAPTKQMPHHLRIYHGPKVESAIALDGQSGMDAFLLLGQMTVYFEMRYSEANKKKSSTVIRVDKDVERKSILLTQQVTQHRKLKHAERSEKSKYSKTTQTEPAPYAYVLIAHRDKKSSFDEDLLSAYKKQPDTTLEKSKGQPSFPIIVFDKYHLKDRYGPTFKNLCSFVLTYSERKYQQLSE